MGLNLLAVAEVTTKACLEESEMFLHTLKQLPNEVRHLLLDGRTGKNER